jgi:hypothetical protein
MDQARADGVALVAAAPGGHPQRGEHQLGLLGGQRMPADDGLGVDVDDEDDVDEPSADALVTTR